MELIKIGPVRVPGSPRILLVAACSVAVRPRLWGISLIMAWRLGARRWWRRAPFLPLPDDKFLRFRLVTMYGGNGTPEVENVGADVVAWLDWCRTWKSASS